MIPVIKKYCIILWIAVMLAGCDLPENLSWNQFERYFLPSSTSAAGKTTDRTTAMFLASPTSGYLKPPAETQEVVLSPDSTAQKQPEETATVPIKTVTPTYQPTTATPQPLDKAGFVTDVTIRDGKRFYPGRTFTKTWRLANVGETIWTSEYRLVFDHGDQMGALDEYPIPLEKVYPWQEIDISVELTAPDIPGSYTGYWKIRNPQGETFGINEDGNTAFWVEIEVIGSSITAMATKTSVIQESTPSPFAEN